jgi:O-glycosyl hydrolase
MRALLGAALLACAVSGAAELAGLRTVEITVRPEPRQTFGGFGASMVENPRYKDLVSAEHRELLARLLWKDLNLKVMRLWFDPGAYEPAYGRYDPSRFVKAYVSSGRIAEARANGVEVLLLAPSCHLPARLAGGKSLVEEKKETFLKAGMEREYAALLATFLKQLKDETGVVLDATGIVNEPPPQFGPAQMAGVVRCLREELDERGLRAVKIIAPETCNTDGVFNQMVDALKADPAAWRALDGVASHSYNMGATEDLEQRLLGTGKGYWMTEAGANGPEQTNDVGAAAALASRALNDLNHLCTHWIWFIGAERHDPRDDQTRLIRWRPDPGFGYDLLAKYHYLQQLSQAFAPKAVFRKCESSLDKQMVWTYGRKPHVNAAAARNRDGRWAVAISNFTAPVFDDPAKLTKWEAEQGGWPGETFSVTVALPGKEPAGARFAVRRSNAARKNWADGTVEAKDGRVTVTVGPLELVTLRSERP